MYQELHMESDDTEYSEDGSDTEHIEDNEDGSCTEDYDLRIQNVILSNKTLKRDFQKLKAENQILQTKISNIETTYPRKKMKLIVHKECVHRYNELLKSHTTLSEGYNELLKSHNNLINLFHETCRKIDVQINTVNSNHNYLITQLNQRMGFS